MMVQCEGKNIAKPSSDEKPWELAWSKTHLDLDLLDLLHVLLPGLWRAPRALVLDRRLIRLGFLLDSQRLE